MSDVRPSPAAKILNVPAEDPVRIVYFHFPSIFESPPEVTTASHSEALFCRSCMQCTPHNIKLVIKWTSPSYRNTLGPSQYSATLEFSTCSCCGLFNLNDYMYSHSLNFEQSEDIRIVTPVRVSSMLDRGCPIVYESDVSHKPDQFVTHTCPCKSNNHTVCLTAKSYGFVAGGWATERRRVSVIIQDCFRTIGPYSLYALATMLAAIVVYQYL